MNRKCASLIGAAAGAFVFCGEARSEELVYTYDALGRLVSTYKNGGPNSGQTIATAYDPAGNRSCYAVGGTGCPPPPPPPPSGNQPPTTTSDSLTIAVCSIGSKDVLANDTDPEGNYPLSLVSVTGADLGVATVVSSTTIQYESFTATGVDAVTYTVQDSLGATSTGTLNVNITSGICE